MVRAPTFQCLPLSRVHSSTHRCTHMRTGAQAHTTHRTHAPASAHTDTEQTQTQRGGKHARGCTHVLLTYTHEHEKTLGGHACMLAYAASKAVQATCEQIFSDGLETHVYTTHITCSTGWSWKTICSNNQEVHVVINVIVYYYMISSCNCDSLLFMLLINVIVYYDIISFYN